jgi:hypothetical protein
MPTSTDLDALLVSALYGELSPSEQARLDSHLASHPQDRAALENLTAARELVRSMGRDSGWLSSAALVEPAPAVSAKLVRLAAESAPRPGFFARAFESMSALMRRPAFAAAATVVVLAGGAGIVYMRSGGRVAGQTAAPQVAATAATASGSAAGTGRADAIADRPVDPSGAAPITPPTETDQGAGEYYAVGLDEGTAGGGVPGASPKAGAKPSAAPSKGIAVVAGSDDANQLRMKDASAASGSTPTDGVTAGVARGGGPGDAARESADLAEGKMTATAAIAMPAPSAEQVSRHDQLVSLTAAGKCDQVGELAVGLARADLAYFKAEILTDRRLRACRPYLDKAAATAAASSATTAKPPQ